MWQILLLLLEFFLALQLFFQLSKNVISNSLILIYLNSSLLSINCNLQFCIAGYLYGFFPTNYFILFTVITSYQELSTAVSQSDLNHKCFSLSTCATAYFSLSPVLSSILALQMTAKCMNFPF